jgi:hypothetical protein
MAGTLGVFGSDLGFINQRNASALQVYLARMLDARQRDAMAAERENAMLGAQGAAQANRQRSLMDFARLDLDQQALGLKAAEAQAAVRGADLDRTQKAAIAEAERKSRLDELVGKYAGEAGLQEQKASYAAIEGDKDRELKGTIAGAEIEAKNYATETEDGWRRYLSDQETNREGMKSEAQKAAHEAKLQEKRAQYDHELRLKGLDHINADRLARMKIGADLAKAQLQIQAKSGLIDAETELARSKSLDLTVKAYETIAELEAPVLDAEGNPGQPDPGKKAAADAIRKVLQNAQKAKELPTIVEPEGEEQPQSLQALLGGGGPNPAGYAPQEQAQSVPHSLPEILSARQVPQALGKGAAPDALPDTPLGELILFEDGPGETRFQSLRDRFGLNSDYGFMKRYGDYLSAGKLAQSSPSKETSFRKRVAQNDLHRYLNEKYPQLMRQ